MDLSCLEHPEDPVFLECLDHLLNQLYLYLEHPVHLECLGILANLHYPEFHYTLVFLEDPEFLEHPENLAEIIPLAFLEFPDYLEHLGILGILVFLENYLKDPEVLAFLVNLVFLEFPENYQERPAFLVILEYLEVLEFLEILPVPVNLEYPDDFFLVNLVNLE